MTGHHKTNFDYTLDRGAKYMSTPEQIAEAAAKIKARNLKALQCEPVADSEDEELEDELPRRRRLR